MARLWVRTPRYVVTLWSEIECEGNPWSMVQNACSFILCCALRSQKLRMNAVEQREERRELVPHETARERQIGDRIIAPSTFAASNASESMWNNEHIKASFVACLGGLRRGPTSWTADLKMVARFPPHVLSPPSSLHSPFFRRSSPTHFPSSHLFSTLLFLPLFFHTSPFSSFYSSIHSPIVYVLFKSLFSPFFFTFHLLFVLYSPSFSFMFLNF